MALTHGVKKLKQHLLWLATEEKHLRNVISWGPELFPGEAGGSLGEPCLLISWPWDTFLSFGASTPPGSSSRLPSYCVLWWTEPIRTSSHLEITIETAINLG